MNTYGTATALALVMTAGTALADITPAEVWSDWQAFLEDLGVEVTADKAETANGLTLSNIMMTNRMPAGEDGELTDMTITIPELSLTDNGDGTVTLSPPESLPVTIAGTGEDGPFSMDLIYRTTDGDLTISGDASKKTYAYDAASIAVTMNNLSNGGEAIDFGTVDFALQDVKGQTVMTTGTGREADSEISAAAVTFEVAATDSENGSNTLKLTGGIDKIDMTTRLTVPENADLNDMAAALAAGFSIESDYSFGPSNTVFELTDEDGVTKGTSSSTAGKLVMKIDEKQLRYGGSSSGIQIEASTPQLPFPIAFAMQEGEFDLLMPVAEADDPQDFSLTLTLGDLTLGDAIWGMFDPEGKLARDPATLALDFNGKVRLMTNVLDPAQVASTKAAGTPLAELDALTLNRLLLRLAGAELSGEGDLTFDNEDKVTYDGQPKPTGDIKLKLTGANALLDDLVAMGLLPPAQLMAARGVLGMIAVPGTTPDELTSTIEFTEDGHLIANGMRMK